MTPPLSPEQAAELYSNLLDDVLEISGEVAAALALEAVVAVHPAEDCQDFAIRVPRNFKVVAQHGLGLAERMAWGVAEAAAAGFDRILLRGSDNPVIGHDCIAHCLDELEAHDVVISPDRDGGYGMIGLRAPVRALFDHPMSTHTVLEETVASARWLGLDCKLIEPSFDLDTAADLALLERARADGQTSGCPRTLAYCDAMALWDLASGRFRG